MILYSIRRVSDGKFLHGHRYGTRRPGEPIWASSPIYWRESVSIWKHLKRLCSEFAYEPYKIRDYTGAIVNHWYHKKTWVNFNAAKLVGYEVIETHVKVLGEKQIPATDFVVAQDLEKIEVGMRR
jgi:hypothetical protein